MVDIYTDGGCRGNPGVGAYAMIAYKDNQEIIRLGDYKSQTTNNEMELSALILALDYILLYPNEQYRIYSDSQYAVNSYNDYLDSWIVTGRIYSRPNKELWSYVYKVKNELKSKNIQVTLLKVKGHADNNGNVEVDKLVNVLMDKRKELNIKLDHPSVSYLLGLSKSFSDTDEDTEVESKVTVTEVEKTGSRIIFRFTDGTAYSLPIDQFNEEITSTDQVEEERSFLVTDNE